MGFNLAKTKLKDSKQKTARVYKAFLLNFWFRSQVNSSLAKFSGILCLNGKIWDIWCQASATGAGKYTRYKMSPGGKHQNQIPFIRPEILETEPAVLSIQGTTVK